MQRLISFDSVYEVTTEKEQKFAARQLRLAIKVKKQKQARAKRLQLKLVQELKKISEQEKLELLLENALYVYKERNETNSERIY